MSLATITNLGRRLIGTVFPATATATSGGGQSSAGGSSGSSANSAAEVRWARYRLLEKFADGSIWYGTESAAVRGDFSCYKRTRPLYGPCGRIVEFHRTHLMGGLLDPDAGPGGTIPTCLPIIPGKDAVPESIAGAVSSLWSASNWQVKKAIYTATSAKCGDVFLEAIADEKRGIVRLRVVHPSEVKDKTEDPYGNIRSVTLQRREIDPEDRSKTSVYREEIRNDDGTVTVRTFRDDAPYHWPGTPGKQWDLRWSFVPFVMVKHIDDGGEWGVSEIRGALAKSAARDSQGSLLSDQVECAVVIQYLLTGADIAVDASGKRILKLEAMGAAAGQSDNIQVITCTAKDAKMTPLVFPLSIAEALEHGRSIGLALEADYPELRIDSAGLSASGESRREARRQAEAKAIERRAALDAGLVRVQQMAMTMGGILGFDDYEGFTADSFEAGETDHRIGSRPVFGVDPLDVLAERVAEANAIKTYTDGGAGVPLPTALKWVGRSEKDIDDVQLMLIENEVAEYQLQEDLPGIDPDGPPDGGRRFVDAFTQTDIGGDPFLNIDGYDPSQERVAKGKEGGGRFGSGGSTVATATSGNIAPKNINVSKIIVAFKKGAPGGNVTEAVRALRAAGLPVVFGGQDELVAQLGPDLAGAIAAYNYKNGKIYINPRHNFWDDPTLDSQEHGYYGEYSTDQPEHALQHEAAHALHHARVGDKKITAIATTIKLTDDEEDVAEKVSKYANGAPGEFVAEAYVGMLYGKKYGADVMALYRKFDGPPVPARR